MAEGMRTLFDASAYMLFEVSGDSEAENFDGDSGAAAIAAEGDAQSCSRGSGAGGAGKAVFGENDVDDPRREGICDRVEEEGDGGGSDLEDGVVDQCRGGRNASPAAAMQKLKKSKGCEGSAGVKMMSEREGDRLFWEACLASQE